MWWEQKLGRFQQLFSSQLCHTLNMGLVLHGQVHRQVGLCSPLHCRWFLSLWYHPVSSPTGSCRAAHSIILLQNAALAPNVRWLFVMYTACHELHKKLLYLHHFRHPRSPHLCSWGLDPVGAQSSGCHPGRHLRCSLNHPLLLTPCESEVFVRPRLQLWHPVHLFMTSHMHTGDVHFSPTHSQAQTHPHPSKAQSKTQSCPYTNTPERRNNMWQMLLHCLMHHLKPFGDCTAVSGLGHSEGH